MKCFSLRCLFFVSLCVVSLIASPRCAKADTLIVVKGAGGTEEYDAAFRKSAQAWLALGQRRDWNVVAFGLGEQAEGDRADPLDAENPDVASKESTTDKEQLLAALQAAGHESPHRLWLVLVGHGTSGSGATKFNLTGPDISAKELSSSLAKVASSTVVINCSSASGPFLPQLSRSGRVVVTATRNGGEINFSRFSQYLSATLDSPAADLDHDDEVSLLEAFLAASRKTDNFYAEQSRLATEHALLDDNGDSLGTSAEFYTGIQIVKRPKEGSVDGENASRIKLTSLPGAIVLSEEELRERERIEGQISELRKAKATMDASDYWQQLEILMLEMSELYRKKDR